jgi:probable addiction module antidote protein
MTKTKTKPFDPAEYLESEEARAAFLNDAIESGDAKAIFRAIGVVAKAKGMAAVAKDTKLPRESLYRSFGEAGNPEFGTVMKVLDSLDLELSVKPKSGRAA